METKTYNSKSLTDYLLGALSEAESEFFDELSFIDDEFSDRLQAAEKDLLDAYTRGELTGKTLEKFESFYLATPARREKVEFAKAFQIFAEKEIVKTKAENAPPLKTETKRISKGFWANILTIPRLWLQWGFAFAALAFLLFGGWLLLENRRVSTEISRTQRDRDELLSRESQLRERTEQLQDEIADREVKNADIEKELLKIREERAELERELKNQQKAAQIPLAEKPIPAATPVRRLNIASYILMPALRGTGQIPTVSIPPRTDLAAIRLELETSEFSSYRAVLTDQTGKNLWQSGKLKATGASESKRLNLQFPARLLKPQIYTLTVSGISAGGASEIIGSYPFRVLLQ